MTYTLYDSSTGQIISVFTTNDLSQIEQNIGSASYIEGHYNGDEYYIDAGQPVTISANPSDGFLKYNFNYSTKTWELDLTTSTARMRARRNAILAETVDRINSIWYASLTAEQQAELAAYRTALLNVPQQTGWPTTIEWPTKPSWL